ncbi:hypothetical protein ACIGNX_22160 [Actinosynnema sp. NPDC053489]|uniref:hypothetical protein n=1 Tax=Actinosynnema sp. NPDC053489 TaxID=3363916 RepID=UPI0037CA38B2
MSTYWLRHTGLTWLERNSGSAVARAFAGHAVPSSNRQGVTHVYVKASTGEVATASQALTREPHPPALEPLPPVAPTGTHPLHVAGQTSDEPGTDLATREQRTG